MHPNIKSYSVVIFLFVIINLGCVFQDRNDRIDMIIDADTANEVDDLFALVRAIIEPKFNIIGITSAQFHISPLASDSTVHESQHFNKEIIRLMSRDDIALPMGSNFPLISKDQPSRSAASDFIVNKAQNYSAGQPLHLVILGSCTNVASAILQDPSIISKVKIYYIGFWHDSKKNIYDKKEFNSGNDTVAVNVLLDAKELDFNVMTATTCQHLVFEKTDVDEHLKGKGGIADYLVDRWETYERWWTKEDPEKLKWIMWDLAIIEALSHPEMAIKETFITPPENTKRYIHAYTSIESDAMIDDFWQNLDRVVRNKD